MTGLTIVKWIRCHTTKSRIATPPHRIHCADAAVLSDGVLGLACRAGAAPEGERGIRVPDDRPRSTIRKIHSSPP
jgi:hypothetical protein